MGEMRVMAMQFDIPYKVMQKEKGYCFVFFCELSHKSFVIEEINCVDPALALSDAKNKARENFNLV